MSVVRALVGATVAAALTALVVALSRVGWTAEPSAQGELRLAWRFRSERVTQCRAATAQELANLPEHMRQKMICGSRLRPYRLEVAVDGSVAADDTVRPRGARADRPLGIFRQVSLAPGSHRARLVFTPLPIGTDSLGAPIVFDTSVTLSSRQVLLVTYDEQARRLVVRDRAPDER